MSKKTKRSIELPNDVVEEILARLPVKSLLRFKSVNKSFSSLIQNPDLAHKQVHRRRSSGFDHAVVVFNNNVLFFESPDRAPFNRYGPPPPSLSRDHRYSRVVGHSNGLICFLVCEFSTRTGFLVLWNPVLSQEKNILPRRRPSGPGGRLYVYKDHFVFGHDPRSRDCYSEYDGPAFIEAEAYSLRGDSWRPVNHALAPFKHMRKSIFPNDINDWESACSGGFCYWLVDGDGDSDRFRILTLDMTSRALRLLRLPEQVSRFLSGPTSDCSVLKVMEWNESIAVVALSHTSRAQRVRVWLLDSDSGSNNRALLKDKFVIELPELRCGIRDIELVWNDEVILSDYSARGVVIYNTMTKEIKNVQFHETCQRSDKIAGYITCLVSLV